MDEVCLTDEFHLIIVEKMVEKETDHVASSHEISSLSDGHLVVDKSSGWKVLMKG